MAERRFGASGDRLVLEECLSGPEVSFFVIADGTRALPIGTAQDHKRIFDDDRGPNTGGMGAFAPSPLMTAELERQVHGGDRSSRSWPGMRAEGCPFVGFLYVGLMLTPAGPKVIEFNVRFGDPEAQVVLPLIAEPLLPLLIAAAAGRLEHHSVEASSDKLVGVVLASRGYPESSQSGQAITGIESAEHDARARVYHAGTAITRDQLVTAGGRVLTVVGRGDRFERRHSHGLRRRRSHPVRRHAVPSRYWPQGAGFVKYAVVTFGCRVNQADSLEFEEQLLARGGVPARPETCRSGRRQYMFRDRERRPKRPSDSFARSRAIIPRAEIVATGCYATRRPDEVAALPHVSRVIPNDSKPRLIQLLVETRCRRVRSGATKQRPAR